GYHIRGSRDLNIEAVLRIAITLFNDRIRGVSRGDGNDHIDTATTGTNGQGVTDVEGHAGGVRKGHWGRRGPGSGSDRIVSERRRRIERARWKRIRRRSSKRCPGWNRRDDKDADVRAAGSVNEGNGRCGARTD